MRDERQAIHETLRRERTSVNQRSGFTRKIESGVMFSKTDLKEIEKISSQEIAGDRSSREAKFELMPAEFWVR